MYHTKCSLLFLHMYLEIKNILNNQKWNVSNLSSLSSVPNHQHVNSTTIISDWHQPIFLFKDTAVNKFLKAFCELSFSVLTQLFYQYNNYFGMKISFQVKFRYRNILSKIPERDAPYTKCDLSKKLYHKYIS